MRTVVATDEGVIELAFMWLPFFFAMNVKFRDELEQQLDAFVAGKILSEELLDEADNLVIGFIESKFPEIKGLRDYLESLKYVYFEASNEERTTPHPAG